jgi:hypothetical protein
MLQRSHRWQSKTVGALSARRSTTKIESFASSSGLIADETGSWLILPQLIKTQTMSYHSRGIGRK